MIVPMKKVSLLVLDSEKQRALKKLRRLGVLHISISEGSGERLVKLNEQITILENSIALISDRVNKDTVQRPGTPDEMLTAAEQILALTEEKKGCYPRLAAYQAELARLESWGEIDLEALTALSAKGVELTLCEMPPKEYDKLGDEITTVLLRRDKNAVRFVALPKDADAKCIAPYRIKLPALSTAQQHKQLAQTEQRLQEIETMLNEYAGYLDSMQAAIAALQKDSEFERYATGMDAQALSEKGATVSYFTGYLPAEELDRLKAAAKENAWGLLAEEPAPEDDVPTQLRNNKFVSLIYPLTDFLGTVPGYFEYDISGWFLGFILVFFGIIFGDGGYGLLICGVAAALILKAKGAKKEIPPAFLLILLLGGATVLWGLLTCTWFGIEASHLPNWLRSLSLPFISNVNADKIWYPFWTDGQAGLTTSQNVQIFCFLLALVQLSVAHIMGAVRHRKSLKMLADIGSVLQLIGIFYIVLSLVVNSQVFGLGLVLGGIPIGTASIVLIGIGFALSFVFANYEGSIGKSILDSLKGIVSVLLGVVNVFSDIVSYIRLWAVGLAGAAISATVNDLAGPLLGNLLFIVFAIILLVFGHGLNMILNVLSVIVHGVRLNTLEFSSHLDMSWGGHKYKPFEE